MVNAGLHVHVAALAAGCARYYDQASAVAERLTVATLDRPLSWSSDLEEAAYFPFQGSEVSWSLVCEDTRDLYVYLRFSLGEQFDAFVNVAGTSIATPSGAPLLQDGERLVIPFQSMSY
jgi:hypothetical protein